MQVFQIYMDELTNRELGIKLDDLKDHLVTMKDDTKFSIQRIDEKITVTNGRIKKLELWRMFLIGAWAVLSLITPIAWYFIARSLDGFDQRISQQIDQRINQAITNYDNEVFRKVDQ